jgi:serine phosphatase RsbU (regulator of sigma subunit)
MSLLNSLHNRFMNSARKERYAYLRSIPQRRLIFLLLAAFSLFAALGLQASLIGNRTPHLGNGLVWALFSGCTAVAYVWVISRKPAFFPLVLAIQILSNLGLARILRWTNHSNPALPLETLVSIYMPLAIVLMVAAYALFFAFIQSEGRFALRAKTELALAQSIQQTLGPVIHVQSPGYELYGITVPSDKVGGDLVDVVAVSGGRTVAYIADIAGHGLQAGILMGMVKSATRSCLLDVSALAALFDRLNRVLPGVKEAHMYATAAALLLEQKPEGGCRVEYALAGHPPILHLSDCGDRKGLLADEQFPLGLLPVATYRSQTTTAARGDLMVITTDGILEVCNHLGEEFGIAGLEHLIAGQSQMPLPALAALVLETVRKWGKQEDDQTLLLIRILH